MRVGRQGVFPKHLECLRQLACIEFLASLGDAQIGQVPACRRRDALGLGGELFQRHHGVVFPLARKEWTVFFASHGSAISVTTGLGILRNSPGRVPC